MKTSGWIISGLFVCSWIIMLICLCDQTVAVMTCLGILQTGWFFWYIFEQNKIIKRLEKSFLVIDVQPDFTIPNFDNDRLRTFDQHKSISDWPPHCIAGGKNMEVDKDTPQKE